MVARMMDVINYFDSRHSVRNLLSYEEIDVIKLCRYCKNCEKCERFYSIKSEFRKKGFWTFNKGMKYWDLRDPKFNERNKKIEIIPIRDPTFTM